MLAIALKTELDVAHLLLENGWQPEEVNNILAFPLPEAAFHSLVSRNRSLSRTKVTKITQATPTTLYRARQLLQNAGWLEPELNSLLKPHLYGMAPWRNQTLPIPIPPQRPTYPWQWLVAASIQSGSMAQYRRLMALKRMISLGFIITGVCLAVMLAG